MAEHGRIQNDEIKKKVAKNGVRLQLKTREYQVFGGRRQPRITECQDCATCPLVRGYHPEHFATYYSLGHTSKLQHRAKNRLCRSVAVEDCKA